MREGEGSPAAARLPMRSAQAWTFSVMWCSLSMDFVSQEHAVPCDGPKDSNTGG
jgi:hypothetical protein